MAYTTSLNRLARRWLLLVCGLAAQTPSLSIPLSAQSTVTSVKINGNETVGTRELLALMQTKAGSSYSSARLSEDLRTILSRYRVLGFYFSAVTLDAMGYSDDSTTVDLAISVVEGVRTRIGSIEIEGDLSVPPDHILSRFTTRVGDVLEQPVLERDIQSLIRQYEENGYPFARVSLRDISLNSDSSPPRLRVVLTVDEGPRVLIDEIRVEGNDETKTDVIVRESRLQLNRLYHPEKIRKLRSRLNRLNIFSSVSEPELYLNAEGGGGLLIRVQEGNTNFFNGIAGYLPGRTSSEQGILTGSVNLSMRNLLGTARKLNVQWQREDRSTQEIGLQYVEPWLLGLPTNLGGEFRQRQQDSTYVRWMFGLRSDVLLTESFSLAGLVSYESVIPSSDLSNPIVSRSRTLSVGLELQYDTRDDVMSPSSGLAYRTAYQIGGKRILAAVASQPIGDDGRKTVQRVSFDAEIYHQPLPRQVIALGVHGRQITSGHLELADLYRIGGTRTLRGYRESQFLGSRVAWSNLEYRFLLGRQSFVFAFVDGGYYFLPDDQVRGWVSTQQFKPGYGGGLRVETALGNLGVSFAFGEGDSIGQGKIHVGIINEF